MQNRLFKSLKVWSFYVDLEESMGTVETARSVYDRIIDLKIATPQIMAANFLNLLIVDDERSIRDACREVATSLGFTTHVADSAEHAYRLLETQSIDAVLLDLRLPGAGGLEALRRIKERRQGDQTLLSEGVQNVHALSQRRKVTDCRPANQLLHLTRLPRPRANVPTRNPDGHYILRST